MSCFDYMHRRCVAGWKRLGGVPEMYGIVAAVGVYAFGGRDEHVPSGSRSACDGQYAKPIWHPG